MADTSARMLALLGLLQARSDWSGAELAAAAPGHRPHRPQRHRPAARARLPGRRGPRPGRPLPARGRHQAAAAAARRRRGGGRRGRAARRHRRSRGIEETSARALAKLEHVLPHRLQRRVNALQRRASSAGPENTGSNVDDPVVDPALLSEVAAAIRDHVELRFDYRHGDAAPAASRTGWSAGSGAGTSSPATRSRRLGAVPAGLDDAAHARRPPVHPAAAAGRGLHVVRAARGRVLRLDRARPDRRRRAGRGGAGPDQPDRRRRRERRRTTTACWSPAATASRSSRSTSGCSASTSTWPNRRAGRGGGAAGRAVSKCNADRTTTRELLEPVGRASDERSAGNLSSIASRRSRC